MSQPQVTFEIKARVKWGKWGKGGWVTLAEFDSEQSAKTWIALRRLEGRVELWVKEDREWVKR